MARRNEQPQFWIYGLSAAGLLLVFTVGILIPDYWSYNLELERMKLDQRPHAAVTPAQEKLEDGSAKNSLQSVHISVPTQTKAGEEKSRGVGAEKIFETYGKLITMLLGFVSILGVFVGFFVRKSLREIEDDVENRVEKRMKLWEDQKDMVLEKVKTAETKYEKYTTLYDEMKRALDALKRVQETEANIMKPLATAPETVAASLDSDPAFNIPSDEIVH